MISHATLRRLSQQTGHLIFLGFDGGMRLCSRETLHAAGQEWMEADFTVSAQDVGQLGVESIQITLTDTDFSWAWRLRRDFGPGIACQWYLMYRGDQGWESELQFSGELETPRINRDGTVNIEARIATGHTAWTPRVPFESPHSLPLDAEIVLNGTTYRVG